MTFETKLWLICTIGPLSPFLAFLVIKYAILIACEVSNLKACHRRVTMAAVLHNLLSKG